MVAVHRAWPTRCICGCSKATKRARRFYRSQGGVEERTATSEERGGMTIAVWRCIWRD